MTVAELRRLLSDVPDDALVVLAKDAEGNGYSPLESGWQGFYEPDSGGALTLTMFGGGGGGGVSATTVVTGGGESASPNPGLNGDPKSVTIQSWAGQAYDEEDIKAWGRDRSRMIVALVLTPTN